MDRLVRVLMRGGLPQNTFACNDMPSHDSSALVFYQPRFITTSTATGTGSSLPAMLSPYSTTAPHSHVYSLEKHQTLTYVEKDYPVIESSPFPNRRHRTLEN